AVDANWNVVASVGDTVEFTSNDTRAVFPATAVLVQGTASISVTFNSAFSDTITAGDVDTPGIASVASSPVLMGQGTFNINPHGDSVNGGGTITIFANGVSGGAALTVLFGSQSVQGTAASDGASLTCTVPPLSGATVSQKVDLTVSNNGSGTATLAGGFYYSADTFLDTDWDSYPDALENVEGSDPNNWASFPVGSDSQALTPAGPKDLVVKSLKIQLNFAKNNGSVALAGTLAVPKGLDLSKQVPALFVAGNIAEKFKMDAKGKGTPATGTGKDSFTLSAKLDSKKLTVGGATKFSVKLTLAKLSQDDLTALGNQGLANATVTTKNVPLTLIVLFSNTDFRFSAGTAYKATRNKTGTATYPHH
ncbi:MAG: IPT/TIG domain-containing protein, partial [Planctomycetota bacterium]